MGSNRFNRFQEKLSRAVYELAIGIGDVRSRLICAYDQLRVLNADDVLPEFRGEFKDILEQLTRYGPEVIAGDINLNDAVKHTMSRIQNRTGKKNSGAHLYDEQNV